MIVFIAIVLFLLLFSISPEFGGLALLAGIVLGACSLLSI